MDWSKEIKQYLSALHPVTIDIELKQRIASLIDLTTLDPNDNEAKVAALCEKARTPFGDVAAVCVYPQFVEIVSATFRGSKIKAATVANFPEGNQSLESVLVEISRSLEAHAQELDIVFPYSRFLSGDKNGAYEFVSACDVACGSGVLLKIILESSMFPSPALLAEAATGVLKAGADFVKTSTGKMGHVATLENAAVLLIATREFNRETKFHRGVKVSGGIKTLEQASSYIALADKIMGKKWVGPNNFRIGASQLLDDLLVKR